jgi:hypothetical protein
VDIALRAANNALFKWPPALNSVQSAPGSVGGAAGCLIEMATAEGGNEFEFRLRF